MTDDAGDLANTTEGLDLITDLSLLTKCAYFIGQFTSNIARVSHMLMAARLGYIPPFVSLDVPMCTAWSHELHWNGIEYVC